MNHKNMDYLKLCRELMTVHGLGDIVLDIVASQRHCRVHKLCLKLLSLVYSLLQLSCNSKEKGPNMHIY